VTDKPAARRIDPRKGKPVPTDWTVHISEEVELTPRGTSGSTWGYRGPVPEHAKRAAAKRPRPKRS
jgi:hypothetical protein